MTPQQVMNYAVDQEKSAMYLKEINRELVAALEAALAASPYGVRINSKWGDWRDLAETAIAKAKGQ